MHRCGSGAAGSWSKVGLMLSQPRNHPIFVLMTNAEFEKLSQSAKDTYLAMAAEALKSGKGLATPNGEFDAEDSLG